MIRKPQKAHAEKLPKNELCGVSFKCDVSNSNLCFNVLNMADHKLITFDDEYRIRVLDAEKYEASKSFRDNCAVFGSRVDTVKDMAQQYAQVLQKAAKSVEVEKLRAIGMRNRVAALREERESSKTEIDSVQAEKQSTLDRLTEEAQSLQLIVDEQEAQLARLQGTAAV